MSDQPRISITVGGCVIAVTAAEARDVAALLLEAAAAIEKINAVLNHANPVMRRAKKARKPAAPRKPRKAAAPRKPAPPKA